MILSSNSVLESLLFFLVLFGPAILIAILFEDINKFEQVDPAVFCCWYIFSEFALLTIVGIVMNYIIDEYSYPVDREHLLNRLINQNICSKESLLEKKRLIKLVGDIGLREAVEHLIEFVEERERTVKLDREYCEHTFPWESLLVVTIKALGEIGDPRSAKPLVKLLNSDSDILSSYKDVVVRALKALEPEAFRYIAEMDEIWREYSSCYSSFESKMKSVIYTLAEKEPLQLRVALDIAIDKGYKALICIILEAFERLAMGKIFEPTALRT